MVLISEVKEPGDVEAQLGHILQEEKHQAHSGQAARDTVYSYSYWGFTGDSAKKTCVREERRRSWTLTLINMQLRCAAGRDRCTEADEGSPPAQATKTLC